MHELSLSLCGRVAVTGNGVQPRRFRAEREVARPCWRTSRWSRARTRRDELTALLWGDYPDAKAKASLRQALVHLREALADRASRRPGDGSSSRGRLECDASEFLRLAKESPRAAADFDVAGFLDGLHAPPLPRVRRVGG